MESEIEEGLCELAAYLYLLSSLKEPSDDAVVQCDEAALRRQSSAGTSPNLHNVLCCCRQTHSHLARTFG